MDGGSMAIRSKKLMKMNKKPSEESVNMSMMNLIRKVHGMIDQTDIEKHRQSQDHVGALFGNSKDVLFKPLMIGDMEAEWVCVDRVHMKKYVILYCHGEVILQAAPFMQER